MPVEIAALRYYGTWNPTHTYPVGAVVAHNGTSFYALQECTNVTPVAGSWWSPLAEGIPGPPGADGADGLAGAVGAQGPTGNTGPQGPAGADGARGIQGLPGDAGPQGQQGIQGVKGDTGDTGPAGTDGAPGAQGPPGPSILSVVKLTADETGKTNATLANTGLSFALTSGVYYAFRFTLVWRTTVATVGLKVGVTFPNVNTFAGAATISGQAADGATTEPWAGQLTSSGDSVVSTAAVATNTDLLAVVEGVIAPSANGTLMLQYAAETTGATVTLRRGSVGVLTTV